MKIIYKNKQVEKDCSDARKIIKKYGPIVGKKLMDLLVILTDSENLYEISKLPQYYLHALHENRQGQYSLVISKSSKYRLIIYPIDDSNNIMYSEGEEQLLLIKTIKIKIMEVSEHYE